MVIHSSYHFTHTFTALLFYKLFYNMPIVEWSELISSMFCVICYFNFFCTCFAKEHEISRASLFFSIKKLLIMKSTIFLFSSVNFTERKKNDEICLWEETVMDTWDDKKICFFRKCEYLFALKLIVAIM
jgi:hypothetical protein